MSQYSDFYLDYNVRGAERKRLVDAISAFTQADPQYLRAPSFAYRVDDFIIDKAGIVSFDGLVDNQRVDGLIEVLAEQGFVSMLSNRALPDDELTGGSPETAAEQRGSMPDAKREEERRSNPVPDQITVELPLDHVSMDNLTKLLEAKGYLIKKALGLQELTVEPGKDTVCFPWFVGELEPDEVKARIHLISALCEMSVRQKRVTATEKPVSSEKYAFRCFLLRLGFIGEKYKGERKILLKNLSGDSSHR